MRKVMKRVIVGLLALSMMMGTTEASAVSTSTVKKTYQGFYEHETQQLVAEDPSSYPMGLDSFSYAYVKLPGKKYPYFFMRDCYNYSICGISVFCYNKGVVKNIQNFSGQDVYCYKKYIFAENFAGGGCGDATMFKIQNGKIKKVKGGSKTFMLSEQEQVHKASMKFGKKVAKKLGVKFSKFKKVKWKQ